MFHFLRRWLDKRVIRQSPIPVTHWHAVMDRIPLLVHLPSSDKRPLIELAVLFLHRKSIEGTRGLEVSLEMAMTIALQACLPVLKLGLQRYDGWTSVIVYPSQFYPQHRYIDEFGVEHIEEHGLSGEAWEQGPVILSWDEILYADAWDEHNLIIHEFTHKLDMQNGVANGYPSLREGMNHSQWVETFSRAYETLRRELDRGMDTYIDGYAGTSPAEFFAVTSEYFFQRPDILVHYNTGIYEQLKQFYGQDPLRWKRDGDPIMPNFDS